MDSGVKTVEKFFSNPIMMFLSTLGSIGSFLWMVFEKITQNFPSGLSIGFFIFFLAFFVIVHLLSIKVHNKNVVLKNIPATIHEINHLYRNKLYEMFHSSDPVYDSKELLRHEKKVLKAVCERIARLFTALIGRECTATIKIITKENNGKTFCHTYVRSIEQSARDTNPPEKFEIGTGKNTAFDKALLKSLDKPSHFFSPDLSKEKDYANQRSNYQKFYMSTIVVPIRHCSPESEDVMGYLCIDSLAKNRLNDKEHLQLLAAFADQIYNFTSLMRGNYSVLVD